jgi:hypothetical protein
MAETVASVAGQQHLFFELWAPGLEDAATLLLQEAGIHTSNPVSPSVSAAEDLVNCLRSLPLAISHTVLFTKQSQKNLADVLGIYQCHTLELLPEYLHGYYNLFCILICMS